MMKHREQNLSAFVSTNRIGLYGNPADLFPGCQVNLKVIHLCLS